MDIICVYFGMDTYDYQGGSIDMTVPQTGETAQVRIGTSSFSESDWVGSFYPKGTKPADYLTAYARNFNTVEIDATYYAVPARRTVEGWAARTPDDFLISAKFPRSIVHGGNGARPDPKVILEPESAYSVRDRFLNLMTDLGDKLGPLVLQFPYFAKNVFPTADEFLERLDRFLEDLPPEMEYAVEIRNRRWLTARFRDMLFRHRVSLVLVDQAWMPHGDEVENLFNPVTGKFVYIRLLGDRKEIEKITTDWDRIVIDQSAKLERWAELIRRMIERNENVLLYANNHYAGHGPETARQIERMIKGG